MTPRYRALTIVIASAAVVLGLTACGSGKSPSASPSVSGTATTAPTLATSPSGTASAAPSATAATGTAKPAATTLGTALGPAGLSPFTLGMSSKDAAATKLITAVTMSGNCGTAYQKAEGAVMNGTVGILFFSVDLGLVAIYGRPGQKTPEGITLGSPYSKVHAAYPAWQGVDSKTSGHGLVPVPGNPKAMYRINITGGHVDEIAVQLKNQDCYE